VVKPVMLKPLGAPLCRIAVARLILQWPSPRNADNTYACDSASRGADEFAL
jgi:hypothetical protein